MYYPMILLVNAEWYNSLPADLQQALSDVAKEYEPRYNEIKAAADPDAVRKQLAQSYGKENSSATKVGESGFIDNVIPKQFARKYLAAIIEYMG